MRVHRELVDIGLGGMFIDSHPTPFKPGDALSLRFPLWPDEPRLSVKAKVLYVQDGIGMGVEFIALCEEDRERIARYVAGPTAEQRLALRKGYRISVNIPVALWQTEEGDGAFEDACIVTLSKYGACVETDQPLDVRRRVFLVTRNGVEFRAAVAWVGPASATNRTQAGLQCRGLAQVLGFRFP